MSDFEAKIKESFEEEHSAKMRNTSWRMPREAMQELEDELYQESVEDSSDEFIEYMMICYW